MSWLTRLFGAKTRSAEGDSDWGFGWFNAHASSGVEVNQATALTATTVMAAATMLCEDFAKLTPTVFQRLPDGSRKAKVDHEVYNLLYRPNSWQNYFEWAEMMQLSLVLRGNAYSVKIRDRRGKVSALIPVNADWVALWESPDGEIFYRVTPNGLHLRAELAGQPFLIPAEDVFHVRGFSMNGLLGASRISLAKEAIGLALGYERQAAMYMSQGSNASGILTTDSKLTPDAAKRMAADWKEKRSGVQNSGKIVVLEQGLKYQPTVLSATDAQFIAARNLQIQEVTRIFRIPAHMIGDLARSTNNNITQLAQEYINLTMSGYTSRWAWKWDTDFDLRAENLFVDYDLTQLSRADVSTRYNNYARGVMGGFLKPNEARIDDGRNPDPAGDKLLEPANMSVMGSQSSGTGADGGGRPADGSADQSVKPAP
ncbi:HK97 family phage portal protein [Roseiarcus fermentans]|uniref:HK97 family phage portal protein n=1 Tax=Roseiarcus fermentans TaxID=1473586 RepID=A0A366EN46_9HYPH|nr:phage portal protein [Roseiarcus fermentans]RBP03818.1 HK97 family phage portal protein [Roseiarcus fermentans]